VAPTLKAPSLPILAHLKTAQRAGFAVDVLI
jgi:hypothetical protein